MTARIIDGKAAAAEARAEVAREVRELVDAGGPVPGLATILIGGDPASAIYVGGKQKACTEVGINGFDHRLDGDVPQAEVEALIDELNADPAVSGILLQLPTPAHLDSDALVARIDPRKDADGLTPANAGALAQGRPGLRSCTPAGIMELLRREAVELAGQEAVVIGRSILVGRPMAALLLLEHATVTQAHSRTQDLAGVCRRADVLVVAAGVPQLVGREHVKPGAVVIDVGMHRGEDGLHGDVRFDEVVDVASAITPVPGGVGPMTIASLLRNTLAAARDH